jgi:hypothetical protein
MSIGERADCAISSAGECAMGPTDPAIVPIGMIGFRHHPKKNAPQVHKNRAK